MFSVYAQNGIDFYDWSGRIEDLSFSTGENGYLDCSGIVRLPSTVAYDIYQNDLVLDLVVGAKGFSVWEGRIDDISVIDEGISFVAIGHFVALNDDKYTALWSDDSVRDWQILDSLTVSNNYPSRFEMDNNNRLYITAKKGETHGAFVGRMGYLIPHESTRKITRVSFDYECFGDSTNWTFGLHSAVGDDFTSGWGTISVLWSLASNGTTQTGSQSITLGTPREALAFYFFRSAGSAVVTAETGTLYLKITNLRVHTSTGSTVKPSLILSDIVSQISTLNSNRLSSSIELIQDSGLDLTNEIYEDDSPADIARKMADLGDTSQNVWEVGVWGDKKLYFKQRGTDNNEWYVNADEIEIQKSAAELANSVYGIYRDSYMSLRTADNTDEASVLRYGFTRRKSITVSSQDSGEAEDQRDLLLADKAIATPRSALKLSRLRDITGGVHDLWEAKAGDRVIVQNLPAAAGTNLDKVRSFYIDETRYDARQNVLQIIPERPLPTLEFYLTRKGENLT